jgi:hypothetical protein
VTFESLGCYSLIILSFYLFLSFGWRGNDGNLLGALSDSKWFSDYYYLKKKKKIVFLKDASMKSKLIRFLYVVKR